MNKKLYIKPVHGFEINNVEDLIDVVYSYERMPHERSALARSTYVDKQCTKIDCSRARRSFEDLLCLTKTYFPSATECDLMRALKNQNLYFDFCRDIHKIVFVRHTNYRSLQSNTFTQLNPTYYAADTYTVELLENIYNQLT